ncbi:hypothetical protein BP5796_10526 [Coleophoma crateriformis]|uniref:THO complex subunit 2 n=1 Tax=Coleophoma crateriformis TaxID=565419 RepID=A0A3D8QRA4_9HELO|nr:hypothetical protein BP5796_10526 [Coleophoma crateriformis]
MAPGGKRKRNDRTSVDSGESRPSPHRPGNTNLAQHDRDSDRDGRRPGRGGGGGASRGGGRRNDGRRDSNHSLSQANLKVPTRATPTPGPMSPSLQQPSATQTPTSASATFTEVPSPLPRSDPAPFDYAIVTEERVSAWDKGGKREVIEIGTQARKSEDEMELSCVFQELLRAVLDRRIDSTEGGNCVKEILGPDTAPTEETTSMDLQNLFIDTLSMLLDAEDGPFNIDLRAFIAATAISPLVLRQKLDGQVLQSLGLTRDTFIRVGIRQATNLLYKQANYNLLREETEGYAKLVTELFSISGSEPPSAEVVEDAFEKIKGLIGTFDLDVGRVLDITLDVFAAVLIKHFRFFIKLLRVSSWWPRNGETDSAAAARCAGLPKWAMPTSQGWMSTEEDDDLSKRQRLERDTLFWERARDVGIDAFFELGGRQMVDPETKKQILNGTGGDAELDADRQWIEGTGTYPPSGNRIAAQLLGFKLRFYASPARDKDDILPANLIYLTALLIKIGFISLRDLYPHLWPLDDVMPAVRDARMKELQEKEKANRPGGGASNALTMAGALADDMPPPSTRTRETAAPKPDAVKVDEDDTEKLDEPTDQKVQLLVCLLTIGALPEALFILGRFPWLPEAYPELIELINRILSHSIKDVYEKCRPTVSDTSGIVTKNVADYDQSGVPKGQVRTSRLPTRKQLRWPFPDKFDTNESNCYRFYWDEWADNIPVCQDVDDVFTLCGTLLNYSGVGIGRDASLLSKLARIGTKSLAEDHSQQNLARWEDLLKRLLVPALSLTTSNTSVANEIYDMLRFYPVSVRYNIYAEWFEGQISRLPAMKSAFARTRLETLATMKRISMTNLTPMARSLAKTAFASPGIVFSVALSQIEAYTNLTEVVVECAKYFTDLGYDVLVWSLMSSLGGKDRNRNNAEFALLPSRWLLALSRFSGKVFKRYSIMNLSPIIQYVNDQLFRGNSTDLVILKELIAQMAGVVPDTDFTDPQLAAMTGGELLRKQTLINLQDKRYESTKTAKRLMKALTETKLAGPLLLSIAQHRQAAIYAISDDEAHIKLLSTMIDDAQMMLFQYLDLLRSNLLADDFDKQVPGIPELISEFGLDPSLAFMIGRASFANKLTKSSPPTNNGAAKPLSGTTDDVSKLDPDGDESMSVDVDKEAGKMDADSANDLTSNDDLQMVDANDAGFMQASNGSDPASPIDTTKDVLEPVVNTVKEILPENSWYFVSPEFYVIFWLSTLGDLSIPSTSYENEIARLVKEQGEIQKDRSDMSRAGMLRKEEARNALGTTKDNLLAEYGRQVGLYKQNKARLLKSKVSWFSNSANVKPDAISAAFLELCLIPRLLLSPSDTDYCFRMIRFLHDNNTPNFRTLSVYIQIFKASRLRSLIFTCTVREAENLGRFLRSILTDLARWHGDQAIFEKEAWGTNKDLSGFAKAVDEDFKPKGLIEFESGKTGFRSILLSWHKNLNTALRDCLEGTEWMHIRNAISVLKQVCPVFPAVDFMGNNFIKQLEVVGKREKDVREDLSLTGNAVLVQLKKRSKSWIMVQAFASNLNEPGKMNGTAQKSTLGQESTAASRLKPTAPEFKPQSRSSSMGVSTPKPQEVEDGEVDDAKMAQNGSARAITNAAVSTDGLSTTQGSSQTPVLSAAELRREHLSRKDQLHRDNSSKPSSPATSHGGTPRSDTSRNASGTALPERTNANLPSRPEVAFPGRQMLDRHPSRHGDRRDTRDARLPETSRGDRGNERLRDHGSSDRRVIDLPSRDYGRSGDRNAGLERDRPSRITEPPPRWTGPHESLDRATTNGVRLPDNSGRLSRESDMPPPRPSATASDRGPSINPERLSLVNPDRQELINPERAALISGEDIHVGSARLGKDEHNSRPTSRPQSPRRHPSTRDDARRDDRQSRHVASEQYGSARNRGDESHPPPAGPRNDRQPERPSERGATDRSRDPSAFQPTPTNRPIDHSHGRLNANPRQQPDPNFGRLNPAPASDIPSGPRDRNSNARGNRMVSAPQPRRDVGPTTEVPRIPSPERHPPTGPAAGRNPRHSASGQFDTLSNASASQPTTPITSTAAAPSVHPDRLRQLEVQATTVQSPATPAPPPGVHPDRLKAFGNDSSSNSPPVNQLHVNKSRPSAPPIRTMTPSAPPSGPRATQQSPISNSPNVLTAPTGPASASERAARGGQRQLNNIQNMLQQAGQQNVPNDRIGSIRGRSNRMNSMSQPATPVSGPSTPQGIPPPPPGLPPLRSESRNLDMINSDRADLITGQGSMSEERNHSDRDRNGRHRSGHQSRRNSKSPDYNRESKRGGTDEDRSRREHRDRSGMERAPGRERHSNRESTDGRDLMAGREVGASGKEGGRDRDRESSRRHGGERDRGREMPDAQWGQGNNERNDKSIGRSRDARGEERRDSRGPREDGGRKRHSEGADIEGRGREKRPRR